MVGNKNSEIDRWLPVHGWKSAFQVTSVSVVIVRWKKYGAGKSMWFIIEWIKSLIGKELEEKIDGFVEVESHCEIDSVESKKDVAYGGVLSHQW